MNTTDRLDQIEARANAVTEAAPGALVSEEAPLIDRDVPWLIEQVRKRDAALRAVLELHKPGEGSSQGWTLRGGYGRIEPYCAGCVASDEYAQHYPCETVRAIEEALK